VSEVSPAAHKIPWNEPDFSRRMLREHLSQDHDAASRREVGIDRHVDWIHGHVLAETPTRILDLGCGPGLYASRLAERGHTCVGIDFSPASIEYAREQARKRELRCEYRLADVRQADFGDGFGLAMFVFGEVNAFAREVAQDIVGRMFESLESGGVVVLEMSSHASVERTGSGPPSSVERTSGLFSDGPHRVDRTAQWDASSGVASQRFEVVEPGRDEVCEYRETLFAYTDDEIRALVSQAGFPSPTLYGSLCGDALPHDGDTLVAVSRKS
jgi:cyclopropane fatty-acyl-phospholipid synthase-like methyltransferase